MTVLSPPGASWDIVVIGPGEIDGFSFGVLSPSLRTASDAVFIELPSPMSLDQQQMAGSEPVGLPASASSISHQDFSNLVQGSIDSSDSVEADSFVVLGLGTGIVTG